MQWLAIFSNPWRAARLPASAGAGRNSMEADVHKACCVAEAPRDARYSLTYSEIGLGLIQCVKAGIITFEQAIEIGNHLFPIQE